MSFIIIIFVVLAIPLFIIYNYNKFYDINSKDTTLSDDEISFTEDFKSYEKSAYSLV